MHSTALYIAGAMLAGVTAQVVARKLRLPGIVLLLATGVAIGPDGIGLLDPSVMGDSLRAVVGFGVAVILFEGGLNQDLGRLRREAVSIRRLVLLGPFITTAGGAVAAHYLLGWDWPLAGLFGTLVIVTGPTVVTPLLRRIRVDKGVTTILEAEGVFGDAVGAVIAFAALEICLHPVASSATTALGELGLRVLTGAVVGGAVGATLVLLLDKRELVPRELRNIFALTLVIAAFEGCNQLMSESGIISSIVAGMVLGNSSIGALSSLADFKEQLTTLLLAVVFVLLAADVRVGDVTDLGWRGLLVVGVLMFIARPLQVFVCTAGEPHPLRNKLFVSWLAPRGIVAAAVSSLFVQSLDSAGVAGGTELRALVFMTIVVTVVVQGLSARPVASLLRLERPARAGVLVVGANKEGRAIAERLAGADRQVVLIDSNEGLVEQAKRSGLMAVVGDGVSSEDLQRIGIDAVAAVVAATSSSKVNFLVLDRVAKAHAGPTLWTVEETLDATVRPEMFDDLGVRRLAAGADEWAEVGRTADAA